MKHIVVSATQRLTIAERETAETIENIVELYAVAKKLSKNIPSKTSFKAAFDKGWVTYKLGTEKSIWKGSHAGTPKSVIVIAWSGGNDGSTYSEAAVKNAGTTIKRLQSLLTNCGAKVSNKLKLPVIG